ncbi:MAG: protein kinase [Pirellulaceae bacterium]|nr:protein kinase [Pirellulaceae bacterium]
MPISPPNLGLPCDKSLLGRYLESTLSPAEQAVLEDHLSGCVACRTTIEMLAADANFWKAATEALDAPQPASPSKPLTDLSLAALVSLPGGLDTSGMLLGDTPTESALSQTQMLQRWLDPSIRENSLGRIGKYEVLGVVGQGGMGLVLKALDTELDRLVAIKTLPHHVTTHADARLRLAREARAAAVLRHPNIVSVFGLEAWREVPLIVMPLIEGGTLQQFALKQRLTTEEVLSTGLQIAGALAALHAEGIVHRDLKPSNILLQDGLKHVLLSDFGLARVDGDLAITHSDALAGTPFFMSPEQALGKPIDVRSDLFSFGSVLYWLCTAQYPFRGSSNYETLSKLVHSEPGALSELQVPHYLQRLIHRLLAKDPNKRWSSADEVVELLKKCFAHHRSPNEPLPDELVALPTRKSSLRWPLRVPKSVAMPVTIAAVVLSLFFVGPAIQKLASVSADPQKLETKFNAKPVTHPEKTTDQSLRFGALDELDRRAMLSNFAKGEKIHYWLRRLAYLPVEDIPPESIPLVQKLAENPDSGIRELSQVILNKNPFQEVVVLEAAKLVSPTTESSSATENPFQEVSPNE